MTTNKDILVESVKRHAGVSYQEIMRMGVKCVDAPGIIFG